MSKFAFSTRKKIGEKETAKRGRVTKSQKKQDGRAAKKRRRKF